MELPGWTKEEEEWIAHRITEFSTPELNNFKKNRTTPRMEAIRCLRRMQIKKVEDARSIRAISTRGTTKRVSGQQVLQEQSSQLHAPEVQPVQTSTREQVEQPGTLGTTKS